MLKLILDGCSICGRGIEEGDLCGRCNFEFQIFNKVQGPNILRPELLHQDPIPDVIKTLKPLNIHDDFKGDKIREQTRKQYRYCCAICGNTSLKGRSLDTHEVFSWDYENSIATFIEFVALCRDCHNIIHCESLRAGEFETFIDYQEAKKHLDHILSSRNVLLERYNLPLIEYEEEYDGNGNISYTKVRYEEDEDEEEENEEYDEEEEDYIEEDYIREWTLEYNGKTYYLESGTIYEVREGSSTLPIAVVRPLQVRSKDPLSKETVYKEVVRPTNLSAIELEELDTAIKEAKAAYFSNHMIQDWVINKKAHKTKYWKRICKAQYKIICIRAKEDGTYPVEENPEYTDPIEPAGLYLARQKNWYTLLGQTYSTYDFRKDSTIEDLVSFLEKTVTSLKKHPYGGEDSKFLGPTRFWEDK